jgi:hypothetical protein
MTVHDSNIINKIKEYCELNDFSIHTQKIAKLIDTGRKANQKKMKEAKRTLWDEKKKAGRNAPYGWKVKQHSNKLEPFDKEQKNLAVILYLRNNGAGLTAIANKLNAWNLRTRKKKLFTYDSVRRYIQNLKDGQCVIDWREDYNSICKERDSELAARMVKQQKQTIQNIVDRYPETF